MNKILILIFILISTALPQSNLLLFFDSGVAFKDYYYKALGDLVADGDNANSLIGLMIKDGTAYRTFIPSVSKNKTYDINKNKKYFAMGWADYFEEDHKYTLPLLNKYGFKNSFYVQETYRTHPDSVGAGSDATYNDLLPIFASESTLENHSFMHWSPLYMNPEMDGYLKPSNNELRTDNGGGKNALGYTITNTVLSSLGTTITNSYMHNSTAYKDVTWADLSDSNCADIRTSISIFRRPTSSYQGNYNKMLEFLDYLSNKYLGTTGYGRIPVGGLDNPTITNGLPTYTDVINWNEGETAIAGGIFQGCSTTQNHEIWERIFQLHNKYHSGIFGRTINKTHYGIAGGITNELFYKGGTYRYTNSALTNKPSIFTKYYSSLIDEDRSFYDVLSNVGYKSTMLVNSTSWEDYDIRTKRQYHIPYRLNSSAIGQYDCIDYSLSDYTRYMPYNYFTEIEWDSIRNTTNFLNYIYGLDSIESYSIAGRGLYLAAQRIIRDNAWGIIPANVDDSGVSYDADFAIWIEALFQFCYQAGIEIIDFKTAQNLCYSQTITDEEINYFPNFNYDRTLYDNFEWYQPQPDGWSGGTIAIDDSTNSKVFVVPVDSVFYIRQYKIRPGTFILSFKAKGIGYLKVYYIKNNYSFTISNAEPSGMDSVYISINKPYWANYTAQIQIPLADNIGVQDATIALQGKDNQICGLQFVAKCTSGTDLRITNP